MYDIRKIGNTLKGLRKSRWALYREHEKNFANEYEKYVCCKSQNDLAEKLKVERRTIISWEKGNSIPSVEHIIALCDILDCSADYLLGSGDHPEIDPISKASHYSGISPAIIKYGLQHPDYLDCLNFFMLPENCASLFNKITLSTWKKYWIDSSLIDIKNPLKDKIVEAFNEFNAVTPFNDISKEGFKKFLASKFHKYELLVANDQTPKEVKICIKLLTYKSFFADNKFDYSRFIDYLADYAYEPLSHAALLEIQKAKLSKVFVDLFTNYLEDSDK